MANAITGVKPMRSKSQPGYSLHELSRVRWIRCRYPVPWESQSSLSIGGLPPPAPTALLTESLKGVEAAQRSLSTHGVGRTLCPIACPCPVSSEPTPPTVPPPNRNELPLTNATADQIATPAYIATVRDRHCHLRPPAADPT